MGLPGGYCLTGVRACSLNHLFQTKTIQIQTIQTFYEKYVVFFDANPYISEILLHLSSLF